MRTQLGVENTILLSSLYYTYVLVLLSMFWCHRARTAMDFAPRVQWPQRRPNRVFNSKFIWYNLKRRLATVQTECRPVGFRNLRRAPPKLMVCRCPQKQNPRRDNIVSTTIQISSWPSLHSNIIIKWPLNVELFRNFRLKSCEWALNVSA